MGDSQAYPPARPFERLFSSAPRFRDDALEAVKQLKQMRRYDAPYDLHVRQILERAIRKQGDQQSFTRLRPVLTDAARLHLKAADCVDRVLRHYPSPPPVLREASELLRLTGQGFRRPSRPGRKEMRDYKKAVSDFKSIKVPKRLAVAMLRGCGITVPGPTPKG